MCKSRTGRDGGGFNVIMMLRNANVDVNVSREKKRNSRALVP